MTASHTIRTPDGASARFTPHPAGVLATVTFAPRDGQATGGGGMRDAKSR